MQLHSAHLASMLPEEIEVLNGTTAPAAPAAAPAPAAASETDPADGSLPGSESEPGADDGASTGTEGGGPAAAAGKPEPTKEQAAAALEELNDGAPAPSPAPAPALPSYEVQDKDFAAAKGELATQKKAVLDDYANGKLTDAEFFEKTAALDDQLLTLATEHATAQTLRTVNEQNARTAAERAAQQQTEVLKAIAQESKAAGHIDYADAAAGATFDALLGVALKLPDNANKTFDQVARSVHSDMLKMRGIGAAAPAPSPSPAAAPAPKPTVPPSLGAMPAAAAQTTGNPVDELLSASDNPDEQEAAWARLAPAQRQAALAATVPTSAGRRAR